MMEQKGKERQKKPHKQDSITDALMGILKGSISIEEARTAELTRKYGKIDSYKKL